jgi:hypothetical protein
VTGVVSRRDGLTLNLAGCDLEVTCVILSVRGSDGEKLLYRIADHNS